jgi:hypothetical protein
MLGPKEKKRESCGGEGSSALNWPEEGKKKMTKGEGDRNDEGWVCQLQK